MGERRRSLEGMERLMQNFYQGKRVFITGHTGFKGSWLCKILTGMGAEVTGYSLEPPTEPNLFTLADIGSEINSVIGDVRDYENLKKAFDEAKPEIVLHLAAQPLVRESYQNPLLTYDTNVMGTANILECVRQSKCVRSFVNVTTDKVYENKEWEWGYRENEPLDGFDPYSNSKSCSELVTATYKRSFFSDGRVAISTARAGNVIGGGDFSADRIIPDCVRALEKGEDIIVRNPYSTRPYQHVIEPLYAYLLIAKAQYENPGLSGSYNVGPDEADCVTTGRLVDLFVKLSGDKIKRVDKAEKNAVHEANFLKLDCSKLKSTLDWKPRWHVADAVAKTVLWTLVWLEGGSVSRAMERQIEEFFSSRT